MISLHGVDADSDEEAKPTFAKFKFFVTQGSIIFGKMQTIILRKPEDEAKTYHPKY